MQIRRDRKRSRLVNQNHFYAWGSKIAKKGKKKTIRNIRHVWILQGRTRKSKGISRQGCKKVVVLWGNFFHIASVLINIRFKGLFILYKLKIMESKTWKEPDIVVIIYIDCLYDPIGRLLSFFSAAVINYKAIILWSSNLNHWNELEE